jgi:hypothetical protein
MLQQLCAPKTIMRAEPDLSLLANLDHGWPQLLQYHECCQQLEGTPSLALAPADMISSQPACSSVLMCL